MSSDRGVFIIHHIPGRVRIGVEALRRSPSKAEALAEAVRECPDVVDARANAWAACLAVEYELEVPLEAVLASLAHIPELSDCGACAVEELKRPRRAPPAEPPSPDRAAELVLKAAAKLNSASSAVAPRKVDLKLLVPGVLVGVGLLQAVTRRAPEIPHWITLVKYGFDTFAAFNQDLIQSFFAGSPGSANSGKTGS